MPFTTKHLRYHNGTGDGLQPEKGQGEHLPSARRERKNTYIEKTASEAQYAIGSGGGADCQVTHLTWLRTVDAPFDRVVPAPTEWR